MAKSQHNGSSPAVPMDDDFQRCRHARYAEDHVVYHITFRTVQGFHLLKPDEQGELSRIIAGVLDRARKTYDGVKNHATNVLSNHVHLELSGIARQLAPYIGFFKRVFKREVSRRWGPRIGWRGIFEPGYQSSAVITPAAKRRCLKYILAQGVKENLVERPGDWPGFSCASALVSGRPVEGYWFNGTAHGRALQRAKRKKQPSEVRREDYREESNATFDPLPAMAHLSPSEYQAEMAKIVAEVEVEARQKRQGKPVLGVAAVLRGDIMQRSELPRPPWFEERRRMIVWDDPGAPEVRAYRDRYWRFQREFRAAADRWRDGDREVEFPPGAYWPGRASPVPHPKRLAA